VIFLSDSACEALNSEITIVDSIKYFPNGKVVGPESFSIELYRNYSVKLASLLLRMFILLKLKDSLTFYDANISLILKEGRDETEPSSYRPIALLNSDFKMFSKLLANRLNTFHPISIWIKLVLFLIDFNCLMLEDIIYHIQKKALKWLLCAFDQLEWPHGESYGRI